MAEQILKTIFQLKRGKAAAWANSNPVLRAAEPGYESDTGRLKVGDGVSAWNDLPYLSEGEIKAIQGLESELADMQGLIGSESEGTGLFGLIGEKANAADVYMKNEIDAMVSSVYVYKGTVKTFAELPVLDLKIGDVYNIELGDLEHGIVPGDNVVWNGSQWDKLAGTVDLSAYATKEDVNEELLYLLAQTKELFEHKKFEILGTPEGTIVEEKDDEIRVMVPKTAEFKQQSVGATGNANMFYMQFRAYAPEGAVSFKEGDRGVIVDEMFDFNGSFAGVDKYGRKYSVVWLALASYDAAKDAWNYFGKTSTVSKYIGWNYVVEWYDANGKLIDSDGIRINLSNEDCHYVTEPYYMAQTVKEISFNGSLLDRINNRVSIMMPEFALNDNGEFELDHVNVNKLVQTEGDVLIFDGGSIE